MSNWQEGQFNPDYILHHKSIVGQIKYESIADPARVDEISIERHDNGDICIVFTTHPHATNDSKQGSVHERLAYNSFFQELQRLVARTRLEFFTTNLEEVHRIRGRKGQERSLIQALVLLENYDNTLVELSKTLRSYISPDQPSLEDLTDEIVLQKERLRLLEQVFAEEAGMKKPRKATKATRMTKKVATTKTRRRKSATKGKRRKVAGKGRRRA